MKYPDKAWYVMHTYDKIVMGQFEDEATANRVADRYLNVEVVPPNEPTKPASHP